MKVCILANRINGKYQEQYLAYERSLMQADIPFETTIRGGKWTWLGKIKWELEMCEKYPNETLIFTDAFDYLFVGTKEGLGEIVSRQPLLFSCDRGEHPWPTPALESAYDQRRKRLSPWCWVNGSGPAGKASEIAKAIRHGLQFPFPEGKHFTDQMFWHQVYLQGFGELDQMCEMTLTLYWSEEGDYTLTKDKKIVNNITGTSPQFIHASGRSWCWIPEELIPPPIEYREWK